MLSVTFILTYISLFTHKVIKVQQLELLACQVDTLTLQIINIFFF